MLDLNRFFVGSVDPSLFLYGTYNPWLVALSVVIAIFASGMALQIAGMARLSDRTLHKQVAIITGSAALGGGIWSMHFIGMLAFQLCTTVAYDQQITMLSMLPSLAASWVALQLLVRPRINRVQLLMGGVLVGAGIGAMHYSGMAAMQMAPLLRYDPWFFALSIVVAVVLAMLALWIRFGLVGLRGRLSAGWAIAISGVVMGLAIAGMHYTGMAAARFVGTADTMAGSEASQTTFVALAVSLITVALTIFVAAANGLLRYRQLYLLMQASESRLRSIVDTAADGLVTFDAQGTIQTFNPAAQRVFGWQAAEVIGKNIDLLFSERDAKRNGAAHVHADQPYTASANREVMTVRKDGTPLPIRVAIGRVALPDHALYVAFITDISEQREMQEALREAKDRAEMAASSKTTFLANMSHEIRTPMNAIIGFTDLLMNTALDAMQQRHLTTVRNSARSLLGLLNDILDTAKLEKGAVELELKDFSLKQLLDQVADSLRLVAQAKRLDLTTDFHPALPEYYKGDALRIQQVLINLLGNAIKFTEYGGVRLAVFPDQALVHFTVHDSGIGIPADRLEKIFQPFAQADPSMSRRFGGTGLGTTIARQLVELMGGRIDVQSTVGVGSVFHVLLPLVPGEVVQVLQASDAVQLPPLRILVADDVVQNVELLNIALSQDGHQVVIARDGLQAVQAFTADEFDVVLMDVQMPHVDGLEATRRIRAHEQAQGLLATPIIALTASVQEQDKRAAQEVGMDGFVSKPLDLRLLMSEIANVVEHGPHSRHTALADAAGTPTQGALTTIDWVQGVALWGNTKALAVAIQRFVEDNNTVVQQIEAQLQDENGPAAMQQVHRLRGTSGNLALRAFHHLTLQMEGALVAQRIYHARALLTPLQEALAEVAQALKTLPDAAQEWVTPAPPPSAWDVQSLRPLALTAIDALGRGELDMGVLQQLGQLLRANQQATRAHALDTAIQHFDFERAQTQLSALIAWLDQSAQEPPS